MEHRFAALASRSLALATAGSLGLACAVTDRSDPPGRAPTASSQHREWRAYGGDPGSTRYSSLDQIHRGNVGQLEVAWTYRAGESGLPGTELQCNPIVVGDTLYAITPLHRLVALDAATGELRWSFDPFLPDAPRQRRNRGVAYWEDSGDGQGRIFFSAGSYLYALDATNGRRVDGFGESGRVDLREGVQPATSEPKVDVTTPGVVFDDLLVIGSRVSEMKPAAAGEVRAYDVRSGALRWRFHLIPRPGELGYDTWPPEAWREFGGVNAWSGLSLDAERALVFAPTGSATFDFYGGDRAGDNLFANSLVALDARTGAYRWHFQVVHHDLWDRDLPSPPSLVRVEHGGRTIDAAAQITKSGHVFLFDRQTGEPVFPVEERATQLSDVPGERASPTQPVPTRPPPFTRQTFTEADVTQRTPEARAAVLERLRTLRSGEPFLPPSLEGSVMMPEFDGGGSWGGAAFDPDTHTLYVNSSETPAIITLIDAARFADAASTGEALYVEQCASCHAVDRRGDEGSTPSLVGLGSRLTPEDTYRVILAGRDRMPAFPRLLMPEVAALIAYLTSDDAGEAHGPERAEAKAAAADPLQLKQREMRYVHAGYERFLDPEGYPAIEPPWGTLTAIDLDAGSIRWQVPLGEHPELRAQGLPPTGTRNYGGPIVTAGGLVFIAASSDGNMRAFDKRTGEVLWQAELPFAGFATPATYEVNGRQYVVVAAGGGKLGKPSGDAYVAFALPQE